MINRINTLINDVARDRNEGIGKPEPLKHGFHGYCPAASPMSIGWSASSLRPVTTTKSGPQRARTITATELSP
ncbi:type II toxin-antitoxin system YoeB family toxin [uncultured Arthrobacter sp.]|uniref:type II toxin-antitoxin system YoeB family toxin n=1 Tax=uncultured Arthrobacter sp. TaxID=114050 RepID=UPI003216FBF8